MDRIKKEAEEYSEYVRQQMGDTLTSAIAEIAEKRPEDPIEYLAEKLYSSKKQTTTVRPQHRIHHERRQASVKRGDDVTESSFGYVTSSASNVSLRKVENEMSHINFRTKRNVALQMKKTNNEKKVIGSHSEKRHNIREKSDDTSDDGFEDFTDTMTSTQTQYTGVSYVHGFVKHIFEDVKDIFDDDDIT